MIVILNCLYTRPESDIPRHFNFEMEFERGDMLASVVQRIKLKATAELSGLDPDGILESVHMEIK